MFGPNLGHEKMSTQKAWIIIVSFYFIFSEETRLADVCKFFPLKKSQIIINQFLLEVETPKSAVFDV